jgi:hypothetical protein
LSVVVLSVVHVSQPPFFSLAVVLVHDLQFFSSGFFDLFSYQQCVDHQKNKVLHSSQTRQAFGDTTREGGFSGCAFPVLGLLIQQTHLSWRYYLKES